MINIDGFLKTRKLLNSSQKKQLNIFIFLFLLAVILEMLGISMVVPIINLLSQDDLLLKNSQFFTQLNLNDFTKNQIIIYSLLFLLFIYALKAAFITFLSYKENKYLEKIKVELSEKLFSKYLKKPYAFHLLNNSSNLIRNVEDIEQLLIVLRSYMMLFTEIVVIIGVGSLLLYFEPVGTISSIFILGLIGFGFHSQLQKKIASWGLLRQLHAGYRMMHLQQGLRAIKDIKVLGRENKFIKDFSKHQKLVANTQFKSSFVAALPRPSLELLTVFGIVLLILIMMLQDKQLQSFIPILALFAAAAFRLMPSIVRILHSNQLIQFGIPVLETLYEEFNNLDEIKNNDFLNQKEIIFKNQIKIKSLNFSYSNSKKILSNINLTINKGEMIGLIGSSGTGKTTLINIILGLLEPSNGEILVDNINIQKGKRSWQDQIGYVPQNIYLNDDSINKNIAFGVPESEIDQKIIDASIKGAQLSNFINSLDKGSETRVGETGDRISGGQRQRIGIARAIYKNPKILILDEFTNSLDSSTEKKIIEEVNLSRRSKTIIMISHNLDTISNCEKIYRLTDRGIELT
jgi:ABC-type multidrug transport system fused ATPase/permease subunit